MQPLNDTKLVSGPTYGVTKFSGTPPIHIGGMVDSKVAGVVANR